MSVNYGKKFEEQFKKDWLGSVPDSIIIRLYDNTSGFYNISNVCDFVGYSYPNIFLIECKTHKGASLPFDKITQYDKLKEYADIKGVVAGVVLFLYEKSKVMFIPINTLIKLKKDGEKSVGLRHLEKYDIIEIPSKKKRIFMTSDYSVLLNNEVVNSGIYKS